MTMSPLRAPVARRRRGEIAATVRKFFDSHLYARPCRIPTRLSCDLCSSLSTESLVTACPPSRDRAASFCSGHPLNLRLASPLVATLCLARTTHTTSTES